MKVILKKHVKGLGSEGEVVDVNDGYARNYLLPRGIAVEANTSNMNVLKDRQQRKENEAKKVLTEAEKAGATLNGQTVTIKARAGDGGRLFGSVTNQDIADAIKKTFKLNIDRRRIDLDLPIKAVGEYRIDLRLHPQVSASITVQVESQ